MAYRHQLRQAATICRSAVSVGRRLGFRRTARLALSELAFDLRHGTETSIELRADPARRGGPVHEATNPLAFAELITGLPTASRQGVFLDLGAGKGRALILAARHGFRRALGVEKSAELCAVGHRNLAVYRRRHPGVDLRLLHADAATFDVPVDVGVVFLFNPFGGAELDAVCDRFVESVRQRPRPLHVVYLNPRHADLLLGRGFVPVHRHGTEGVILRSRH